MLSRKDFETLDENDNLKDFRSKFSLPEGLIYFDGNSLGAMPKDAALRANEVVVKEWGHDLIQSWNKAGWFHLTEKIGNKIAKLIGANEGEVICTDATGLNLFKILAVALKMRPERKLILMEGSNFPTDNYTAQGLSQIMGQGHEVKFAEKDDVLEAITEDVAVVSLTQVHYKKGHLLDMKAITKKAHQVGALIIWDLCHSAGALPIDLNGCDVDFAVGCTYKYLNGGPGSPAFLFVASRHQGKETQPLTGWWGHKTPFSFEQDYEPTKTIWQFLTGTQPILSLATAEVGIDIMVSADMEEIRKKSIKMSDLFIQLIDENLKEYDFSIASPLNSAERGSQISLYSKNGYPIIKALIAAGVVGDFRAPDIMRFGFTPLYLKYTDLWDAVQRLKTIMENDAWKKAEFNEISSVT